MRMPQVQMPRRKRFTSDILWTDGERSARPMTDVLPTVRASMYGQGRSVA